MRKLIRGFEFLINLSMLLQLLRDMIPEAVKDAPWLEFLDENYILSLPTFILLFMLMVRHEGCRLTILLIVPSQLLLILCRSLNATPPILSLLTATFVTFSTVFYYFLPTYDFPALTGMYTCGYRILLIPGKEEEQIKVEKAINGGDKKAIEKELLNVVQVAVFYPTVSKQKAASIAWAPQQYLRFLHDVILSSPAEVVGRLGRLIPYPIFHAMMHVVEKVRMRVQPGATLMRTDSKYPVILFSHGLGSHYNSHSSILRDLASKGCIVLSLQHYDFVDAHGVNKLQFTEWVKLHRPNFERRVRQLQRVIDYMSQPKNLDALFNNNNDQHMQIQLDWDRLTLMGHSFGGATALFTALANQQSKYRVGGVILLDPAMDPLNEEEGKQLIKTQKLDIPLLIINSEYFNRQMKYSHQWENERALLKINEERSNVQLNCYLKETGHENFGDMAFVMPRELRQSQKLGEVDKAGLNIILINKLIEFFLQHCILSPQEINLRDKSIVISEFSSLCKDKLKLPQNPLQVIEIGGDSQ